MKKIFLLIIISILYINSNSQIVVGANVLGSTSAIEKGGFPDFLYGLGVNTGYSFLNQKLLIEKVAENEKMTTDQFIKMYIDELIKPIDTSQLLQAKLTSSPDIPDSVIRSKLQFIQRMQLQEKLVDSLKQEYNFKLLYIPEYPRKINVERVHYFPMNILKSPKKVVYIISDFRCSSCEKKNVKINELYNLYKDEVEFRYVYYSHYVNPLIYKLCLASSKKEKFKEIKDELFRISDSLNNQESIINLASKNSISLDLVKIETVSKIIFKNNDLLKKYIYSTPTFVINGGIYDQDNTIDFLETLI